MCSKIPSLLDDPATACNAQFVLESSERMAEATRTAWQLLRDHTQRCQFEWWSMAAPRCGMPPQLTTQGTAEIEGKS